MWRDLSRFVPLTPVCILAILYISFRSLPGVFLPAVTVIAILCWTLGITGFTGTPLSLGSIALPPLVLVLGTIYLLHVIADYYECAQPGRTAADVMFETLKKSTPHIFYYRSHHGPRFPVVGGKPHSQYPRDGSVRFSRHSDCFCFVRCLDPGFALPAPHTYAAGSHHCPRLRIPAAATGAVRHPLTARDYHRRLHDRWVVRLAGLFDSSRLELPVLLPR